LSAKIVLLLGAQLDFDKAYRQGGDKFYHYCDRALEILRTHPLAGSNYSAPYRRLLIPKTHLGIFYSFESERIIVHAILDLRADPERIASRFQPGIEG